MDINADQRRANEIKRVLDVIAAKMSIPLYLVFILTDYLYTPHLFLLFASIRIAIIGCTLLIRSKVNSVNTLKGIQKLAILLVAVNSIPITIMIWIIGDLATPYYAGLNLVALGAISFIPLGKRYLLYMVVLIYGPFLIGAPFLNYNRFTLIEFLISLFFIVGTIVISVVINYFNEIIRQKEYEALRQLHDKVNQIQIQKSEIDEKNKSLIKIGELAAQVAHDIRSPVTALDAVFQTLGNEIDPKKKSLIKNAAKRINDIANNLVSNYRENLTQDLSALKIDRAVTLNSLIDDIVEEKRLSLDSNHKITLKSPESISIPPKLESSEFQRVISNLINNSIEALDKAQGIVDIELFKKESTIKIVIRDNGKGISKELISKVFEKGISGKSKGAGLGLSHAKEYIESIGGSIAIDSIPTKETHITIQLKDG